MKEADRTSLTQRPAHFPLYCAICGVIGADTVGWVYPAHGYREEGQRAPVHKECLTGRADRETAE